MSEYRPCGQCKHWHEWENQNEKLKKGDCYKIPKGTSFDGDCKYNGWSFEDEVYDDCFNCFDER